MAKRIKKIEVVPYNPAWPKMFEEEASLIKQTLNDNLIDIQHVGSTSVIGLAAKPRIDILGVVKDPNACIDALKLIGYEYTGEYNIPFHFGFRKRSGKEVNLHLYELGNPEIELNLLFRDYLRKHPDAVKEYANLKAQLLTKPSSFEKNNSILTGYNQGKDTFIRNIIEKTGFDKLRVCHCAHIEEFETAKMLRQKNFFDNVPISDPYLWTFNHPEHVHFILYKGVKIIGYAHFQLWPEHRVALRIIVIDEPYRNHGYGWEFLKRTEHWFKQRGYHILQMEASPKAKNFYFKHGYTEMPFNDPEGEKTHPLDTPLGKLL